MEEFLQENISPLENGAENRTGETPDGELIVPQAPSQDEKESTPPPPEEEGPDYAAMAASDLSEIQGAFPELRHLKSLAELQGLERYAELREAGLSATEAAAATQYERLRRPKEDTRAHLSSSVPLHTAAESRRISLGELSAARDLFPSLSDREIEALYKRASKKQSQ